jgi:iron complex transport system substrate-binding protein
MSDSNSTEQPPRVVSLLPSATEHVAALGHASSLVGISHECDFPEGLQHLPILTSSKVLTKGSSLDIDRDVRRVLKDALAVYDLDADKLEALKPEVIVTQDLCDVCAVSLKDVEAAAAHLLGDHVRIVNLHPLCLEDIWTDLAHVADALGAQETLLSVMAERQGRIDGIQARAEQAGSRPHTLTIEWLDPVMIGGLWMPELIELGGGQPMLTKRKEFAPTLTDDELRALDPAPEVVLVKPCGFDLARTRQEAAAFMQRLDTFDWPAVRNDRVYVADGNAYFNRPGPRIVESLEILAACMHPEVFAAEATRLADGFCKLSDWR